MKKMPANFSAGNYGRVIESIKQKCMKNHSSSIQVISDVLNEVDCIKIIFFSDCCNPSHL